MNMPVDDIKTTAVSSKQIKETQQQNSANQAQEKRQEMYKQASPIELAYLMIYDSVITSHQTAQLQAKELENNAQDQNLLIDQEQQFNFYSLPSDQVVRKWHSAQNIPNGNGGEVHESGYWSTKTKKVGTATIAQYQVKNQEVSAIRSNFSNKLVVDRQNAQVNETNMNSTINTSEQSMSEGSGIMQMLTSLTNQISKV